MMDRFPPRTQPAARLHRAYRRKNDRSQPPRSSRNQLDEKPKAFESTIEFIRVFINGGTGISEKLGKTSRSGQIGFHLSNCRTDTRLIHLPTSMHEAVRNGT